MKTLVIRADDVYPYHNQAIEATLLSLADDETEILYLWQNDKTVFIGKNQNAYLECKVPFIQAEGGYIARRISGGGAVYHDRGNLNFTFLSSKNNFSIPKNFEIMTRAINKLGFNAELNGRNDVVIDGRKFSGNAFYKGKTCFHHGTVLIKTNREKLAEYLNVPSVKLEAKGVSSVVSRVVNLADLKQGITPDMVADALIDAFGEHYSVKPAFITDSELDGDEVSRWEAKFEDEKWRLGDNVEYSARLERRFDFGTADIRLKLNGSIIEAARIYSDALDSQELENKERLLVGADIYKGKQGVNDILDAFKEQQHEF